MKLISAVSSLLLLGDARVASGSPSIRGGVTETDQERKLQVSLKASFFCYYNRYYESAAS